MRDSGPVYLGFVEKVHGLRGGIVARLFTVGGDPDIPAGTRLTLSGVGDVTVRRSVPRDGLTALLATEEVRSREEAEALRGCEIFIDRDGVAGLDFFPLYGYLGLVLVSGGRRLLVVDIDPLPGNPLLVVETEDGKRFPVPMAMLPGSPEGDGEVEVDLPAGLEDL